MTDSYLTLTTFVPGTKAKADEVNANFSTLKDAINSKAAVGGDATKTFSSADATADKHAVNKSQLDSLSTELREEIVKTEAKFCVKSGNATGGKGDLFSYSLLAITPKFGGTYPALVFSDYEGTQTKISSTPASLSMSGKPNGDYNIFIKPDATLYTLANKIYKQSARPTMVDGDIWLKTSVVPFYCTKYDGTNDVKFLDVPLGKVTVNSAAITAIETFAFNQNGYDVTTQTALQSGTNLAVSITGFSIPDYANGVNKSFNTTYTAETAGFIYVLGAASATRNITIDGFVFEYAGGTQGNVASSILVPVSKGSVYNVNSGNILIFFPMKGVN